MNRESRFKLHDRVSFSGMKGTIIEIASLLKVEWDWLNPDKDIKYDWFLPDGRMYEEMTRPCLKRLVKKKKLIDAKLSEIFSHKGETTVNTLCPKCGEHLAITKKITRGTEYVTIDCTCSSRVKVNVFREKLLINPAKTVKYLAYESEDGYLIHRNYIKNDGPSKFKKRIPALDKEVEVSDDL